MSVLLGTLEASQGASTLGGAIGNYAMNSVGSDLKQDSSGVDGQNPLSQLLAPTPQVQAQAQAPVYNFPQMPAIDQNAFVGTRPISQYFVGGKS